MNFEKRNFGCLVNFPIDIVWKGEGENKQTNKQKKNKQKKTVLFLLSIWHMVTKCTEFIFIVTKSVNKLS